METPKVPDTARSEMGLTGESVVIKGELSCSEDLYIGGQVEGSIELKGKRLTVGPNGRVKGNVNARAAVVQGNPFAVRIELTTVVVGSRSVLCPSSRRVALWPLPSSERISAAVRA